MSSCFSGKGGQDRLGRREGGMGSGPKTDKDREEYSLLDGGVWRGTGPELVLREGEAPEGELGEGPSGSTQRARCQGCLRCDRRLGQQGGAAGCGGRRWRGASAQWKRTVSLWTEERKGGSERGLGGDSPPVTKPRTSWALRGHPRGPSPINLPPLRGPTIPKLGASLQVSAMQLAPLPR